MDVGLSGSASFASSMSMPVSLSSPTIFNFGSGSVSGIGGSQADPNQPTTATSSASTAMPGAVGAVNSMPGGLSMTTILLLAGLGVAAWYLLKHKS